MVRRTDAPACSSSATLRLAASFPPRAIAAGLGLSLPSCSSAPRTGGTVISERAAMNWGMAQTPPLFRKSPFHRFGVRMNKKGETVRDRRLSREEEKKLLDAALQKMNTPEHQFGGPLLHDRIIGALELCCRRGEMLLIQN